MTTRGPARGRRSAVALALLAAVVASTMGACSDQSRGEVVSAPAGSPAGGSGDTSNCPAPTGECACLVHYGSMVCIYIPCGTSLCFGSRPGLRTDCSFGGRVDEVRGTCDPTDGGLDGSARPDALEPFDAPADAPAAD